jgi:hypothetical protein
MMPTTDDLKHRLAQVSAEPPVVGDLAERAVRRGRTIRRRRSGVVVVAVAVAVAGLVLPNLPGRTAPPPPSDQPTPTPTVTADGHGFGAPFPVPSDGRRLVFSGAHPSDPTGFTYTVPVTKGLALIIQTVAPGTFRMYVDNRLQVTAHSWTNDSRTDFHHVSLRALGTRPGDEVTLSFETERLLPGSYRFAVYDSRR